MHTTTWLNSKDIMLSERNQSFKDYMLYDSVYVTFSRRQIYRDGEQISDCQELCMTESLSVRDGMKRFWGAKAVLCADYEEGVYKLIHVIKFIGLSL